MEGRNLSQIAKLAQQVITHVDEVRASTIRLNPAMIKKVMEESSCPAKFKAIHIDKLFVEEMPLTRLRGQYFAWHALELGKHNIEEPKLPPIKGGKPGADEIRIRQQAELFKQHLKDYDIEIIEVKVAAEIVYNNEVFLEGEYEALAAMDGEEVILDLALTGNIRGTYGEYCWGNYWLMDHTHAYLQQLMRHKETDSKLEYVYLLYDYKPDMEYDLIKLPWNAVAIIELRESIRVATERYKKLRKQGWAPVGSFEECRTCQVVDCPGRIKVKPIKEMYS